MKKKVYSIFALAAIFLASCGGGSQSTSETASTPEPVVEAPAEAVEEAPADAGDTYPEGKEVYTTNCVACHQANGQGLPGTFPPLASSDYLANKEATINQVLNGTTEEITVNGEIYPGGAMTPFSSLSDEEVANVLNYIYNSWGNEGGEITTDEIAAGR